MLELSFSEIWRVERVRLSSFVLISMFSGVSVTVLQLQLISIISLRFVISLLKQISSEDFVSKS
jgi:hypothetical protein